MDLVQTQRAVAASPPGSLPPSNPGRAATDFETFLKMLTVQMQNQDPVNPIDSADYAVQLATFSGVEQAVRTNQLLESVLSQFDTLGMAQLAGWVGQEARSAAPVFMDGTPVTLSPSPSASADRAVIVVKDAQGRLVAREEIPATSAPYIWLGSDATGAVLPVGPYRLTLESYSGDNLLTETPIEHYAPVLEVRGGAGGARVVLPGGIEVLATDVTALRAS